jgi:NAD(P)-dependent dehydrogenase (short-subunit alcohol dehydrogenase family)
MPAGMPSEFEGPRTAIVTGGARRIGAELCRALAKDGWHVLIHCFKSKGEAELLAAEIGSGSTVVADLVESDAAETIFAAARDLPPVRLLVNNASRFRHDTPDEFSVAEFDAHQAVNLRAPALLARALAAQTDGGGGLIVNLLDAKLSHPNPDFFSYTVSRYGLAGLTEILARAYGPRRIRVCGIAPAVTLLSGAQSEENFEAMHPFNLLGRGVTVDDVVSTLRFIIDTPTLTGQVLTVDGGQRFLGLARDVQFLERP